MRNGLYHVQFDTQLGQGSGVVHLQDGKIRGGDAGLYYIGDYQLNGGNFSAQVQTARHGANGNQSVFGIDNVTIKLAGNYTEKAASVKGSAAQAPGVSFSAILNWLAD